MKKYMKTPQGVRIEEYDIEGNCIRRTSSFVFGTPEYDANIPEDATIQPDQDAFNQDALQRGEAYITAQGFGQMERQELTALMAAGMLNETQMARARAVLSWIITLKTQATSNPQDFAPTLPAPYAPEEIMG